MPFSLTRWRPFEEPPSGFLIFQTWVVCIGAAWALGGRAEGASWAIGAACWLSLIAFLLDRGRRQTWGKYSGRGFPLALFWGILILLMALSPSFGGF